MSILNKIAAMIQAVIDSARSHLDNSGERVDILYSDAVNFNSLDLYQKSHYRRYEFAIANAIQGGISGDFACGTGYGTAMLAKHSQLAIGADINDNVIRTISMRYKNIDNITYIHANLLSLAYASYFDTIVSFETIEHFEEKYIPQLFAFFHKALKPGGKLIFSTPYRQQQSSEAIKMGFHRMFNIDENKIAQWLSGASLRSEHVKYQNYQTHEIQDRLDRKDFIICVARRD